MQIEMVSKQRDEARDEAATHRTSMRKSKKEERKAQEEATEPLHVLATALSPPSAYDGL